MDLLILGKENCSACDMTKTILTNKGVKFEYKFFASLEEDQRKEYMKAARKYGVMSMPLIINNGQITTLQEVIKCI